MQHALDALAPLGLLIVKTLTNVHYYTFLFGGVLSVQILMVYIVMYESIRNIRGWGEYTGVSRLSVGQPVREMLCLKLLPQFLSHLN